MKASDVADKFGSMVNKQRTPIEYVPIILILIITSEVFKNLDSRIRLLWDQLLIQFILLHNGY